MVAFPLDIRTELNLGGTWTDVSPDVYVRDVKNIVRGLRDLGSTADPSSLTLTLDNRDGRYSQRNAMSPLFGLIGRNTPIRLSVPGDGESYLQLDGRTGNFASTPDAAALDITGDIDVRAEISPDWYGASSQIIIGKWDRPTLQQSWILQITDGNLYFRYSTTGDAVVNVSSFSRPLPQLPERAAVRATLDYDSVAGTSTVTFYSAETLAGPWTQFGAPVVAHVSTAPIFSGSAPLQIGITDLRNGILRPRFPLNGRAHRFEVRNGINGAVVAAPDFRAVAPGATSLVDSAGRTWTLSGHAEIRNREDRFVGEVQSWPNRWSTDDSDRYVPLTARGILQRLGQGAKALDSALRRRIPSGNPIAYWPMEEQADAVQAYSPIPGVLPASVSSVEWESWTTLPSSAPLPRLTGASSLSATVPAATPGQWHVEMVYTADDLIPIGTDVEVLKIYTSGTVRRWQILLRNGRATVRGYNAANVLIVDKAINVGADVFHGWVRLRFYAFDTAGTVTWRIEWQDVGGDQGGYGSTYTGTSGAVSLLAADWPALTEGWGVGHLAVLPEADSNLYTGSDNAYRGETALVRMRRLAMEEGLSFTRTSGRLSPELVGYQRRDSLVSLFEAAATADGGLLTEDMQRIGLHYRDRSSLYTQDPAITLSYTQPGLGPDIEPVDDDSEIVNDVTVTVDGGSSARAVLASGPLSVQPAPDGIGRYDASHTVSLADDAQADPHAYWRLHLGTWDAARFPTVSLLLHKPGAEWLIPLVRKLREGDKIRLTNLPEFVSNDDVDLLVMGWSEQLDIYRWTVTLNCVPAGPWDTAVTDHATYGKANSDGSVLMASATATTTSLLVRAQVGPQWTTDPIFFPIPVRFGGEVATATAIGPGVMDTFGRTLSSSWGSADTGEAWTNTSGATSDYSVSGGQGRHLMTSLNTSRRSTIVQPYASVDMRADIGSSQVATGGFIVGSLMQRIVDGNNMYLARLEFRQTGGVWLTIRRRLSGVETALGSTIQVATSYTAGQMFRVRFETSGTTLRARAWAVGAVEPAAWQISVTDASFSAAGTCGMRSITETGNTNASPSLLYDTFQITNDQRFTVTRSVNGVIKPHAAGTSIDVASPALTSL